MLHGPYRCYHPNGQLREAGQFRSGLKIGEWRLWNEQGSLIAVTHWKRGKERKRRDSREAERRVHAKQDSSGPAQTAAPAATDKRSRKEARRAGATTDKEEKKKGRTPDKVKRGERRTKKEQ
jgi:antitoxin component YwqK of YwqJK toxin-antitoxin module